MNFDANFGMFIDHDCRLQVDKAVTWSAKLPI